MAGGAGQDEQGERTLTASVDPGLSAEPAGPRGCAAGVRIDRYALLEKVGAGGMGEVWSAYDPVLDRRVALKLMRVVGGDPVATEARRQRLTREAQALARLNHANVVVVHDAGVVGEDTFVAMEYVAGETLREWLKRPHELDEILDVFERAGRGLEAAHRAGVVHRDFKPSNVLLGEDGRVRVSDFGIAFVGAVAEAGESGSGDGEGDTSAGETLTATGAVLGTPAYMAPEQLGGARVDARADQFAFCVALYQAISGTHPFAATAPAEASAVAGAAGAAAPTPREAAIARQLGARLADPARLGGRAPAWLRGVVERGLRRAPGERFPDMTALLAAMARGRRRSGRWLAAGAGVVGVAAVVLLVALRPSVEAPCQGLERRLQGAWGAPQAAALRQAFASTGRPYAGETADRVVASLDRYAQGLTAMRVESCRATRVRGDQSETLLDRRSLCLDRRQQALGQLVVVFGEAKKGEVVDRAIDAVAGLPSVADCALGEQILAVRPLPADPAKRAQIAAIESDLARARSLLAAGDPRAALPIASKASTDATALDYEPLLGAVLQVRAQSEADLGESSTALATLGLGLESAVSGGDAVLEAGLWIGLLEVKSTGLLLDEQVLQLRQPAELALRRAGDPVNLRISLLLSVARALDTATRYGESLETSARALALAERNLGKQHPAIAECYLALARTHAWSRQPEKAIEYARRAVELRREVFGRAHPSTARALNTLGSAYIEAARLDEAAGRQIEAMQRLREAVEVLEEAARLLEAALGPHGQSLNSVYTNLAFAERRRGRPEEALRHAERALAVDIATAGLESVGAGLATNQIARILRDLGRYEEALARHREAVGIFERTLGPKHAYVGTALEGVTRACVALGRLDDAIEAVERRLSISADKQEHCDSLAIDQLALAELLWERARPGERSRATSLAREARGELARCGKGSEDALAEAEQFLRSNKLSF